MKECEAENLIKMIIETYGDGNLGRIADIFNDDFVGHIQNNKFGINEFINRLLYARYRYKQVEFVLKDLITFENTIVVQLSQSGYDTLLDQFGQINVCITYRVVDNKISEQWLWSPSAIDYFATPEQGEINEILTLELNNKIKFNEQINVIQRMHANKYEPLTARETECLYYYLNGFSLKEIAHCLHLSSRTIETHIGNIKSKYNCNTRSQLRAILFARYE